MSTLSERVPRLRQPEYTGENRCIPCTLVNLAVAAAGSGVVAVLAGPPAGVAAFAVSLALVYFRGYLVPGTPTLTKRYLPDSVLRLFDKDPQPAARSTDPFDVETVLLEADLVSECRGGEDLCLTPWFEREWNDRIDGLRDAADESSVADLFDSLDVDSDRVSIRAHGDAYEAYIDDMRVGQWESRGAYLADLAAEAVLRDHYPGWQQLGFDARAEVLGSLRLWLDRCPSCDGTVTIGEETVESCCRSIDVLASTCESCGARVFEAQLSPDAMAAE
ncbi:hypothetical protein ACFQJD_04635 [Haloplanus sp. GCM10025708]|uniref:hypothetical protein n=1 Tax=Haloferacaceae TaxID=1644056 RepID=UPI00361EF7CD